MRDDFGKLGRLDAIIERPVEIRRQLRGLITRDQGGDRDEATISRRQVRAFPNLADGRFGITLKCGRHRANRISIFIGWGIWVCGHVVLLLSDFSPSSLTVVAAPSTARLFAPAGRRRLPGRCFQVCASAFFELLALS
jgi:hypothetical protein